MPQGISVAAARWLQTGKSVLTLSLSIALAITGSGAWLNPPARAEIVKVGYGSEDLPALSEADQARLDALQSVRIPLLLSNVSPDGKTVVVATTGRINSEDWQVQFLDLTTGELSDSIALGSEVLSPDLPIQWVNNDVLRFVQQGFLGPWEIVTINRKTQIVSHTSVYPTETEEGEILGMAPDFSKFVIRVFEEAEDVVYMVFLPSLDRVEVARLPEGFSIQPPSWSADGDQVVLVTSAKEERDLYERTPFSPNFGDPVVQDALGRLSPDENLFRQRNEVRVFDFTQEQPLQFELKATDGNGDAFANAAFSPDGKTLMVKMYKPSHPEGREHPTYVFPSTAYYRFYDLQGNLLNTLEDASLSGPFESQGKFIDNQRVLFLATVGLNRPFFVYDLAAQTLQPLSLPPGTADLESWQATPNGQTLIYTFSSVTQPPELFTLSLEGSGSPQQLTSLNQAVAEANRVQAQEVSFSTRNGPRQGILIQPAGQAFPPKAAPIVFWQQGGPGFSMVNEFAVEVEMPLNLLPNFGVAVLSVPLSGREGFGPEFYQLQADGQNFGQADILEGVDIVSQLVGNGWTTARQVGVTGCSYGGYYASQMIARFPNTFAASNPQCSLLDTLVEWQLGYSSLLSYLAGTTPMEDPTLYQQMSPLYNAQRIRTPTMLFHGSDDFLNIDVVRNFHDVIAANDTSVMLYEFEGMGHSLHDLGYQRIAAQLQVNFFRRHLSGQPR
ncbi:MAG: S9 family peptidase [Cyanobacteria bacterium Co-bin13]|nr:S9 family peptidase [Cyanobacteria bacterium Co-bin13]